MNFPMVLTLDSIVLASFAGIIAGLVLQAIHPEYSDVPIFRRAFLKGWMIGIVGALFFIGQEAVVVIRDGPRMVDTAIHIATLFGLWVLFSAAVGIGAYIGHRSRIHERLPKK